MSNERIRLPHLKIAPALRAAMGEPSNESYPAPPLKLRPQTQELGLESPPIAPAQPVSWGAQTSDQSSAAAIDIIIAIKPDPERPQDGISGSKTKVRAQLEQNFPERSIGVSDFFLQFKATVAEIHAISGFAGVDMIWPNPEVRAHLLTSVETVRASAGWRTFEARGKGITWAVMDTGISAKHPQFTTLGTIDSKISKSFIAGGDPLVDPNGHGTHVAGIIAGMLPQDPKQEYTAATLQHDSPDPSSEKLDGLPAGMAPSARLISVQVLRQDGGGTAFDCIRGLEYLRSLNQGSRERCVDGANLSLGYDLEASTYGCGFSPICEEVNRAVEAGICVVVSCGNSGYGVAQTEAAGVLLQTHIGLSVSISDPANAEQCIAVGSVHKREPHRYGVSYFSSKGPTVDGRQKPDLVAPGERIISCNAAYDPNAEHSDAYCEMSGTSMAAPHVSGAIASFLSVRPDYRGSPREIKRIFKASAVDLGRAPAYQGSGMVDAFKALISV